MMPLDLKKLGHFLAVVDQGSFARAADIAGVSQPAISKSVAALEAMLLLPLLERGRHGARPTAYGRSLAARARILIGEERAARAELEALRGVATPTLAIGVSAGMTPMLLPAVIARYASRWPDTTITCDIGTSSELFDALQAGNLELVLSAPGPHETRQGVLRHQPLFTESDRLVCGIDHPLAGRSNPAVEELARYPWIIPRKSDRLEALQLAFAQHGVQLPQQIVRAESSDLARGLLPRAPFICLATESVFACDVAAGVFAFIESDAICGRREAMLTVRNRTRLSSHAQNFSAALMAQVGSIAAKG